MAAAARPLSRWRLAWALGSTAALFALVLLALWLGSAREGSLALALDWTARHALNPGALQAQQVQGTLRDGGRIGDLRWQQGALTLQAQGVQVAWDWRELLRGRAALRALHADRLTLTQADAGAPALPQDLALALEVDVPFTVGEFALQGAWALQAQGLRGRYRYDTPPDGPARHTLALDSATLARGQYRLDLTLQAQAPMALRAQLQGQVSTQLPGGAVLPLQAQAGLQGALAGAQARVQLQAHLSGSAQGEPTLRATAQLQPWAAQPLAQAHIDLAGLNLADLWPQAPQTRLSGQADVQPQPGEGHWRARVALDNTHSGPWDRQRLPLQQLRAELRYAAGGQWQVQALQAHGAGGTLQAQGRWQPGAQTAPWQGQAQWQDINPAALHSALAPWPVQGRLSAQAQGPDSAFDLHLRPRAGHRLEGAPPGLALGELHARGVLGARRLQLDELRLDVARAQLRAHGEVDRSTLDFDGQATLALPGGQARTSGRLALGAAGAPGGGQLQITLAQAAQTWAWLQALAPQWSGLQAARDWQVRGGASLTLAWQGALARGWDAGANAPDAGLRLQARLDVPELVLQPPGQAPALTLQDWHSRLDGPVAALQLQHQGRAVQGPWQADLNARGRADLSRWRAARLTLDELTLAVRDRVRALDWQLTPPAGDALQLRWQADAVELAPGQLQLQLRSAQSGSTAATPAQVSWQRLAWGPQGLQTEGGLQNLPLAWLERLAGPGAQPLDDAGLVGALWLQGDWALHWPRDGATPVTLQAQLRHQRGDLALRLDDGGSAQPVSAGIREAVLQLRAQGPQLQARLRWDSERAGQVQGDLSTRLQPGPAGWHWPDDAALKGRLSVQLPQIGVWSLLAPPGWRMRGTLQAEAELSGTRALPRWSGRVQAGQLALRSAVDGFEFVNGQLQARLQDDQLVIERFELEGPGGARTGGRLQAQGHADWRGANGHAEIALQLQAQRLRLSDRPDRRLVVSGQLVSQLSGPRFKLRGALVADQASILLPDELTPRLGDDVVVKGRAGAAAPAGPRLEPDVQLELDLGPAFAVQGSGLDAQLQGRLQWRSSGPTPPRLLGEVRTTRGSYRAYGASLQIETGVLRFAGDWDNPQLDILAIRPHVSQRVGVQVSGTAQAPVLRLMSEPDLPDTEKLSWLVLGRSGAGPGGEAAILQQAALSLMGRRGQSLDQGLASALGLDEVGIRTGTGNPALLLGKRLGSRLYVLYGQSLSGALSTVSVFYKLNQRLMLRGRAGPDNAVELIFTLPYD